MFGTFGLLSHRACACANLAHSVSPAADALRTAMLAVGAVHLRYVSNPNDQEGAWRITQATRPRVLELVRCALEGPDGTPKTVDKTEVELVLAALLSCTIASVSGGV